MVHSQSHCVEKVKTLIPMVHMVLINNIYLECTKSCIEYMCDTENYFGCLKLKFASGST